jgi:hypothetical protein
MIEPTLEKRKGGGMKNVGGHCGGKWLTVIN